MASSAFRPCHGSDEACAWSPWKTTSTSSDASGQLSTWFRSHGWYMQRRVEALEQAVVDHIGLAAPPLLGRRPEEDDLARELVGDRGQRDRGARRPTPPSCCGRSRGRGPAARRTRRGSRCAARRRPDPRAAWRGWRSRGCRPDARPRTRAGPGPRRPRPKRGAPRRPAQGRRGSGARGRGSRRGRPRRLPARRALASTCGSAGRVADSDGNETLLATGPWAAPA